jgi:hypothetical protein
VLRQSIRPQPGRRAWCPGKPGIVSPFTAAPGSSN